MAYNFIEGLLLSTITLLFFWLVGSDKINQLITTGNKTMEEEKRMFKGIEDGAITNIMTSIDEFKTKYLN